MAVFWFLRRSRGNWPSRGRQRAYNSGSPRLLDGLRSAPRPVRRGSLRAEVLLIDDWAGRSEAERRHLTIQGTLGVLGLAAQQGLNRPADGDCTPHQLPREGGTDPIDSRRRRQEETLRNAHSEAH